MKFSDIAVLVILLLPMLGCDEKATGVNSQTGVTSTPAKEPSPEESFAKLQREAEAGDADAQYQLGSMYSMGGGVPVDAVKAVDWFQRAAAQGLAKAQNYLGYIYLNGEGVPKDAVKALEWFLKAAAQGDADSYYKIGGMYANGDGVPKDDSKAAEWYQKAAEQGHDDAQFNLGEMYATGDGVPKDAVKAVEWYQKAAAQGYANAQFNLGVMYFEAKGVPKDLAKSAEWFQKAAAQGMAEAQYNLGWMYDNGDGVPKDTAKVAEWYQKAAEQGIDRAQFYLGKMYFKGDGVNKDRVIAYAWLNLAAAQDFTEAKSYRDIVEKSLSKIELIEGQRLASNWKKGGNLTLKANPLNIDLPNAKPSKQMAGTAFAVSIDGHALTNHHVINGCTEVKVAGREGVAKVITSDSVNDLALLQLPGKSDDIAKLNPDPGKLRQGEDIIVFGYPLNFVLSSGGNLTPGTLSALTGLGNNTNQLQITAPIQPGSSGSPVMDKKGNVVGLVSMKLDDGKMAKATGQVGQNVNFAVNGQTVRAFLDTNNVLYKTGGGFFSHEKSNADIADEARKWTVLVECWK